MNKIIFALLTITTLTMSCKKDNAIPIPSIDLPFTNTNTGTQLIYEQTTDDGSGPITEFDTSTVSNRDTAINSKIYRIVDNNDGELKYYNRTGIDYYQFQSIDGTSFIEGLYLKDAAIGTTWSQNITAVLGGTPVPLTLTYTIMEKGITRIVKGNSYSDVISVKTDLTSPGLPPGAIVSDIKTYYARNIGLIEGKYFVDVALASLSIHTLNFLKSYDLR